MTEHHLEPTAVHHQWDSSLPPVLEIDDGDVIHFELKMAGHQQIRHGAPFEQTTLDPATVYHLQGPVAIKNARPGQTLAIEVLSLQPGEWGWCGILPRLGLLPEFYDSPVLRYFDLRDPDSITAFASGVTLPLNPFLGVMATLPSGITTASAFPPHRGGGNIDTRHLVAGTTLMLPVFRPHGLFSCGDPHAAQGDGEVCVNALECDMTATLRFTVIDQNLRSPRFVVPAEAARRIQHESRAGYHGTMGINEDLMAGARTAVRGMIDLLTREHDLTPQDAYLLCSLAGNLRIFEIVDAGVWNVGMTLSRSLFTG